MGQKLGKTRGKCKPHSSSLDALPEECISQIISFSSARDACVAASVSKTFRSTVNSDSVWDKFLPPDYSSLYLGLQVFPSKKELYFSLCNNPVLIDHEHPLDKNRQRKWEEVFHVLFEVSRVLTRWISIPESRFEQILEILDLGSFALCAWLNTRILSPRTHYSTYIVYKTTKECYGFRDSAIEVGIAF